MIQKHLHFKEPQHVKAAIEALLFIYGEPMPIQKMVQMVGADKENILEALFKVQEEMKSQGRGLRLVVSGDAAQLVTAPEFALLLQEIVKDEFSETLTPAALETLSIVAYRGPLTRAEIDYIRGVNSTFILRALLMRGMIERHENPKRPNSYIYRISFDMMRILGLERVEHLPEYEKFHTLDLSGDGSS